MYQSVIFPVFIVLLAMFVAVFAFFKHVHPNRLAFHRIQGRDMRNIVLTHLGVALVIVSQSYSGSHPYAFPCYAYLLIIFTMVPMMLFPLLGRLYIFYRKNELNSLIVKHTAESGTKDLDGTGTRSPAESAAEVEDSSAGGQRCVCVSCIHLLFFVELNQNI
jgi:hypothetical protein